MPALADNRVALTDVPADELAFYPLESDATVVPRSLAPAGVQKFPTPGSPEWGRLNRRRAVLIRQSVRCGLSGEEEKELEWLQSESLHAVDRAFPRPPVDLQALAQLEKQLKNCPNQGSS